MRTHDKKPSIVITSNEPWGNVWFSKQHYANELAHLGYQVYFLNPPLSWSLRNVLSFSISQEQISSNLAVISYNNNFPIRIFRRAFIFVNDFLCSTKLYPILKNKKIIWWHFDPFRLVDIMLLNKHFRIYHVVDPFDHIPIDQVIARKVDLVVSISEIYRKRYAKLARKYLYIPHGISESEYQLEETTLAEHKSEYGQNYILFVGTLNKDVDYSLLRVCAESFRDRVLVIVGPLKGGNGDMFQDLLRCNNIRYVGEVHAQKLKYFIKLAGTCIVPYLQNGPGNKHRTPLKIINYLSQRKPIVTTINYELAELNDKAIFVAYDKISFVNRVKDSLDKQLRVDVDATDAYLARISYPLLVKKILRQIDE